MLTKKNIHRYIKDGVLVIPECFNEIEEKAAYKNDSIRKVIIPSNVLIIGKEAFAFSDLEEIEFGSRGLERLLIRSYAFADTNIKEAKLNFNVVLEEGCFKGCTFLEKVILYHWTKEIPKFCFENTGLNQIVFNENITKIGTEAFSNTRISDIQIPGNIIEIEEGAFSNNQFLKKVEAFDLEYIPVRTFANCGFLEKVIINYSKEKSNHGLKVGGYAFSECFKLKVFKIMDGYISSIKTRGFSNCAELREIDLSSTRTIGEYAFSGAKALREIGVLNQIEEIDNYAFSECYYLNNVVFGHNIVTMGNGVFQKCKRLREIELPKTLSKLGRAVFEECTGLTNVRISCMYLEMLSAYTFNKCFALKSIIFSKDCEIKKIDEYCFFGCESLVEIALPEILEFIGDGAFLNCKSISTLNFEGERLVIKDDVFSNCECLKTIEVKGTIDYIGAAFSSCYSLTTITIPFPNQFGQNVVSDCRRLEKIQFQSRDVF